MGGTPQKEYDWPHNILMHAEEKLPKLLQDLQALRPAPSVIVYDAFVAHALFAAYVLRVPAVSLLTLPGPGSLRRTSALVDAMEAKPWVQGPREKLRQMHGFDALMHGIMMEFYSPYQNLVTTIDELFVPSWSSRQIERFGQFPFRCVGPLVNPKVKRIANANCSNAVGDLPWEEIDQALSTGSKVLYISMGTVGTSSRFWKRAFGDFGRDNGLAECTGKELVQHVFQTCFEVLGNDKNVLVIMSTGPQEDVLEGLPETPGNFIVRENVPQLQVLTRCHAFITHGGANSTHEALSFGVPLAVVPMFADQPIIADAVARTKAGFSFRKPLETLNVPALRDAVSKLVDSSESNTYRAAAELMMKKIKEAGGVAGAADMILQTQRGDLKSMAVGGA